MPNDATKRDRVWAALLKTARTGEKFTVDAVYQHVADDVSRRTVERTLRGATEVGVIDHPRGSGVYRAGTLDTTPDRDESDGDEADRDRGDHAADQLAERVEAAVDEIADGWDDTESRLDDRREAARVVLRHAVKTGDAVGRSDAVSEWGSTHRVQGQNDRTWWRQNVRPVLSEFGSYDNGRRGYVVDSDDLPTT